MLPTLRSRRSVCQSSPTADRGLSIYGFLPAPLPPIVASPVCTPSEVMPTNTPDKRPHAVVDSPLYVLPTWIATPPTPPGNTVRRAVTCRVRPASPLSPSVSFPAQAGSSSSPARRPRRPRALTDPFVRRADGPESNTPVFCTSPDKANADECSAPRSKDDVRRYHALMELLATEVSYLADLRAFFSIYLRNLPTLCRTPSTFSRTSSRNNSLTHLPKTSVPSDSALHPLTTVQNAKRKPSARQLFTDREVDVLTRNAEQVLQLHENFVEELRVAIHPLGFSMDLSEALVDEKERIRNIDLAVGEISTKFATEASRFDAYQIFCSGHLEALHLVHRVQQQYPVEWEAYEQQCASLIVNMGGESPDVASESASSRSESEERHQSLPISKSRRRTTSLSSIDSAVRKVRANLKDGILDGSRENFPRRLAFLDYMIKPVQRICKYPLLLDQLRPSAKLRAHPYMRSHVSVVVDSAAQAMRHVASAVDEARHRQDVKMQSSLIVSRIALVNPSAATSHMASAASITLNPQLMSVCPPYQILTPSFLSSLGTILLAGSLDVMHYRLSKPPSGGTNINAKYLGAFLYLGGYLILVKVSKGKVYEPKHWFSLANFDVIDLEEEDTSLPCTFSLIGKGHQYDLTAACQREKDTWLSSIHESRLHPPSWINEPTSSIQLDEKGELVPSILDEPFEMINTLPTIQSLPELVKDETCPDLQQSVLAKKVIQDEVFKPVMPYKRENVARRQSSVTTIFSTSSDADTIIIRRSSPTARFQVDQGLQDVISEPVLAARSKASVREELFQAPKILRNSGSFSRSNSALNLTGLTKKRLSKHESVRVPRRKSSPDVPKASSLWRPQKLSIVSSSEGDSIFQPSSDLSASYFSQCSLTSTQTSLMLESPPIAEGLAPKFHRPSSSVSSTPSFKTGTRPTSPATSQRSVHSVENYRTMTRSILRFLTKEPRRRRARSVPCDETLSRPRSPVLPDLEFGPTLPSVATTQHHSANPPRSSPPDTFRRFRLLSTSIAFRHSSNEPRTINKGSSIFKHFRGLDLGSALD
ncbi:hypothetical protein GGX14DRAFT_613172 [Mycena pura]|uniref:DH domain-containing protein n=1 Tax=Mycena pura TaxID=153505 RepID=A0AAD6YSP7_9AGAR|nr:hypothetical protein GGX14DRAFT_613172 [Mycena pura]